MISHFVFRRNEYRSGFFFSQEKEWPNPNILKDALLEISFDFCRGRIRVGFEGFSSGFASLRATEVPAMPDSLSYGPRKCHGASQAHERKKNEEVSPTLPEGWMMFSCSCFSSFTTV